jgi:hypothetical protein
MRGTSGSHQIYIAVDADNVATIYQVGKVFGFDSPLGGFGAQWLGTIDLADTPWSTLTSGNFW